MGRGGASTCDPTRSIIEKVPICHRQNSSRSHVYCNDTSACSCCLFQMLPLHHSRRVLTRQRHHQRRSSLAQVGSIFSKARSTTSQPPCLAVLHPAGNVAEHLVANGLARVVDWHAGMLASSGGMERLRAAEKTAKEKRACLYANAPAPSAKSNGTALNDGNSRQFDATVVRVWSADQISVVDRESGKERRLQLSSTRGPKWVLLPPSDRYGWFADDNVCLSGFRIRSRRSTRKKPASSCASG